MSAWVSSGCSGFLPQSKDVWVRLIGHAKLTLSVRGISRANTWGYGDKAWVGLLSVLARCAKWLPSALQRLHGDEIQKNLVMAKEIKGSVCGIEGQNKLK